MQAANRGNGTIYIYCVFINHRLHHHGVATTDSDAADFDRTGFAALDGGIYRW
jgi:predicted GNAT family acetyltransferase